MRMPHPRKEAMPVSVKVYYGKLPAAAAAAAGLEIRRFIFRPDDSGTGRGVFRCLIEKIRALYNGLNLNEFNLCWRDDDGDFVVFSSDDELRVALNSVTDSTLRIYIRERDASVLPRSSAAATTAVHVSRRVELYSRVGASHGQLLRSSEDGDLPPSNRSPSCQRQSSTPNYRVTDSIPMQQTSAGSEPPSASVYPCEYGAASTSRSLAPEPLYLMNNVGELFCSECDGEGRGVWYKCTVCANYYLCSECENRGLHDLHIMVRIPCIHSPK